MNEEYPSTYQYDDEKHGKKKTSADFADLSLLLAPNLEEKKSGKITKGNKITFRRRDQEKMLIVIMKDVIMAPFLEHNW